MRKMYMDLGMGAEKEKLCAALFDLLDDEKKAEFGAEMTVNQVDVNPDTDAVALAVYMMCTNLADGINGDCVLADKGMTHNCLYRQPAIKEFPPKAE